MKKKMSLNKKLSLSKQTISVLTNEQKAAQAARLTTIGRTCIPWSWGETCGTI